MLFARGVYSPPFFMKELQATLSKSTFEVMEMMGKISDRKMNGMEKVFQTTRTYRNIHQFFTWGEYEKTN